MFLFGRTNETNRNFWFWFHLQISVFHFLTIFPDLALLETKYSTRVVQTAYGSLRGILIPKSGSMPRDIEGYLGIPYASAPAASLRFMPPLTPSHFSEVKVADKFGPVCPQLLPDVLNRTHALSKMPLLKYTRVLDTLHLLSNQSEDCLYLNIYVPRAGEVGSESPSSLAIVVVLQGESWEWGSGSLVDGSALASVGNVIVITLNYRLGILGFLQTSSQQGNFAIMDIVAALNWIRENAQGFGGDSNRVTLLGHRTGAVLANFLMLAPVATELFHRVILLSGSALSPWSFQRHAKGNVRKMAQYFNCISDTASSPGISDPNRLNSNTGNEIRDLGPCLREVPLDELLAAFDRELVHPRFISRLGPLIDSTVVKADFVSEMKHDPNGQFSRIPLLVGSATIESFEELNTEDVEDGLPDAKRDRILRTLVRNIFVFHLNEIYSTVKNEYTDWEKPRKDFIDVRDSILNIMSDGLTVAPLVQVASMHSNKGNARTYFLQFQYEPDHSVYPHRIGSISEDLLQFSMGHPILNLKRKEPSVPSYTTGDSKASTTLIRYLTNFIISGDPNSGYDYSSSSTEDSQLPYWDSYDPVNQLYLELGSGEARVRSHYRGHKMALWLNLIPQLHQSGGTDVSMLHHNFREEKADYYEGQIREQSQHSPTLSPPFLLPKNKPRVFGEKSGGREATIGLNSAEHGDSDDYRKNVEKTAVPTLSPTILSSTECPPNSTVNNTVEGGIEVVRQLAASNHQTYWGHALGVVIGVGCCFLFLNVLVYIAIYHQRIQSAPNVVPKPRSEEDEGLCDTRSNTNSLCRHHQYHHISGGFPYSEVTTAEEYEEDLIQELRSAGGTPSSAYLRKEISGSSGFCSPPIPEPPPPPRSSIPPSLAGSMVSLASSISASGGGTGILRRPPPERDRETSSTSGSMKKRVQIQEISV